MATHKLSNEEIRSMTTEEMAALHEEQAWSVEVCETVIIENTDEARDQFGHMWGSGDTELSRADIQALLDGKCVAFHDGEYTNFLTLKAVSDEPV